MDQFGPAGFSQQSLQTGSIAAHQAGLADAAGQHMAGIGNPRFPTANQQAAFKAPQGRGCLALRPLRTGESQPGHGELVGRCPHQQRPSQPQHRAGQTRAKGRWQGHQRVFTVWPFHCTWPRSRLRIASKKTTRKNNTGSGKIRLIQVKRPTRRVITSNCSA